MPAASDHFSLIEIFDQEIAHFIAIYRWCHTLPHFLSAYSRYVNEFMTPFFVASTYFADAERERIKKTPWLETVEAYTDLLGFNLNALKRNIDGSARSLGHYYEAEIRQGVQTLRKILLEGSRDELFAFMVRQAKVIEMVAINYPQSIQAIAPEYGFHFENGRNPMVAETDRFMLYQVMPVDSGVTVRANGKPIIIVPPYVLGANILGFLPQEHRSYAHAFANFGIPTYIRIQKPISTTPAVQIMTAEDDTRDTRYFCEVLNQRHGRPVTLNGYCQGGYASLINLLSGELDGLVDAFITCVSPMDGTRSRGLAKFLNDLPPRFNDLAYGTKTLANGNPVADGNLMGWVYKLKSIEMEGPVSAFFRDLTMFGRPGATEIKISKTAAALNYWLLNERTDLPLDITRVSFAAYNHPISKDGTLPLKLFGRSLNLKRLTEKGIKWLICYGESDDLVEKETALAPADYIDVEVTPFPKGHVAIATSWSQPVSPYALHTYFGTARHRGPVRFQLDLEAAMDNL